MRNCVIKFHVRVFFPMHNSIPQFYAVVVVAWVLVVVGFQGVARVMVWHCYCYMPTKVRQRIFNTSLHGYSDIVVWLPGCC